MKNIKSYKEYVNESVHEPIDTEWLDDDTKNINISLHWIEEICADGDTALLLSGEEADNIGFVATMASNIVKYTKKNLTPEIFRNIMLWVIKNNISELFTKLLNDLNGVHDIFTMGTKNLSPEGAKEWNQMIKEIWVYFKPRPGVTKPSKEEIIEKIKNYNLI